ncbi:YrdB family protein [Gordonia rhizosphera]|uniref:DUF2568 domain-containing protein n=1 Tax=Gordonia rhizosphera NBRC 16068 TaxID=1108045 RepID=K6WKA4_9ACTN|nr:YrdB family protein [Gordonia rhizosphera]GAB92592.1 hypothetical protein GORHZ_185_00080 [Gordonia rhizosphera NBRC 16068]
MKYLAGLGAFVLELVAWGAVASLGLVFAGTGVIGWLVSVVILIAVVGFWGVFMAPKAAHRLPMVPYYVVKAIIYLVAAYAIFRASPVWALVFVVAVVITEPLFYRHNTGQEGPPRR